MHSFLVFLFIKKLLFSEGLKMINVRKKVNRAHKSELI